MKKTMLPLLLALTLCVSLTVPSLAASNEAVAAADRLHELGLFNGTGQNADGTPNYELDRTPNRAEAVTLLVRLLGKEAEATAKGWYIPFSDVADWAHDYVGYAYANGLTSGISDSSFGSGNAVSATQYLTFVLRALGYEDGVDFQWDRAWELTDSLGITAGQFNAASGFTRGDAVIVSVNALEITPKGSTMPLLEIIRENLAAEPQTVSNAGATFTCEADVYTPDLKGATATVEVVSAQEAVFTIDMPFRVTEANNYVISFYKRTGRPLVGDRHTFSFEYFRPEDSYTASGYYSYTDWENWVMDSRQEDMYGANITDTSTQGNRVTWRVTLPAECPFNFDMIGEYQMECTIGTFLGGGAEE